MNKLIVGSLLLPFIFLAACGSSAPDGDNVAEQAKQTPIALPTHAIGETIVAKGFEFTLSSVTETKKIAGSFESAGPNQIFVVAKYAFKNLGAQPIDPLNLPTVDLVDAKGTTYSSDIANSAFADDEGDGSGLDGINPGIVDKSAQAWRLPEGSFDPATWKIIVRASPELEFKLK